MLRPDGNPTRPLRHYRRGGFVVAAIVVLVLIGVAALVMGSGGSEVLVALDEPATAATTAATAANESAVPTPSPAKAAALFIGAAGRSPTRDECPLMADSTSTYAEGSGFETAIEAFEATLSQDIGKQPGEWVNESTSDTSARWLLVSNEFAPVPAGVIIGNVHANNYEAGGWLADYFSLCHFGPTTNEQPALTDQVERRQPTEQECPLTRDGVYDGPEWPTAEQAYGNARGQAFGSQPGDWYRASLTDRDGTWVLITNRFATPGAGLLMGEINVSLTSSGWLAGEWSVCVFDPAE